MAAAEVEAVIAGFLARHGDRPLLLGLSGGADSAALLTLLAGKARLRALHVHHGLHDRADALAEAARAQAERLHVPFVVRAVRIDPKSRARLGLEAAARAARRQALMAEASVDEALVLAHHADDQAETLLLKLLRGEVGLALGLRPERWLDGRLWLRPLLPLRRAALRDVAGTAGLPWIEDPGNDDLALDRNWLRHAVLPLLASRRPQVVATLARSADSLAAWSAWQETEITRALAAVQGLDPMTLHVPEWQSLPECLRMPVLIAWVQGQGLPPPRRADLLSISRQVGAAGDRQPGWRWPGAELRRWRGLLWLKAPTVELDPGFRVEAPPERVELPGKLGVLEALPLLPGLCLRWPRPGDRIDGRPLTEALARRGIPPWQRSRLPLLCLDDRPMAIPSLLVSRDCPESLRQVRWRRPD